MPTSPTDQIARSLNLTLVHRPKPGEMHKCFVTDYDEAHSSPLAARNSFGVLKALKKRGVPAKESGDTGPMVMKEYSREAMSKDE